ARRAMAVRCQQRLADALVRLVAPRDARWTRGVYHLDVVRVQDREALQSHLAAAGIGPGIHYPIHVHQQKAYQHLWYKAGDFPVTERVAREIVSLPMYPQLLPSQQDEVVG